MNGLTTANDRKIDRFGDVCRKAGRSYWHLTASVTKNEEGESGAINFLVFNSISVMFARRSRTCGILAG